jgi:hypothetical protein
MQGGPSHMDLFDPKPKLTELDGKPFPGTVKYDNAAQAEAFAARVRQEAGPDADAQVARVWMLAHLRPPTEGERAAARSFLRTAAEAFAAQPAPPPPAKKGTAPVPGPPTPEQRALAAFCQALLSSNRFLYVD